MISINRRDFLKNSSLAAAGMVFVNSAMAKKEYNPHLSFSTLGCPKWSLTQIVNAAVEYGYEGIEIRGIQNDLDITKGPDFGSSKSIDASIKVLKDKHLKVVSLDTSTNLHYSDAAKRKSNLDEAKSHIDLAQKLNCPYIRVFPDKLPKDQDRNATIELIISGLKELGEYAKGTNVSVLMETHGDVVKSDDHLYIMKNAGGPHVGLIWDIGVWTMTHEPPSLFYGKLKQFIKHTHFHDVKVVNGMHQLVLTGKGELPLKEVIKLLEKDNYQGFYSFEWEKRWLPDVEEPEIAFPQYVKEIKTYF
jgi:sugar phosphate isomerase/epimerase